jgi:hypothetical protein
LRPNLKTLICFFLGGLPLALIFLGYNTVAYGHPLQTGYGQIGLQDEMKISGFTIRLSHYAYWLTMTMSPLLPLGWLGAGMNRKLHWRIRAMLIAWFGSYLIFYSCYSIYDAWWYTRFLLPGVPALILGALLTARDVAGLLRGSSRVAQQAVLLLLLLGALGCEWYHIRRFNVFLTRAAQASNAYSCLWADGRLPDRSLVAAKEMSGALKFYTQRLIIRYDLVGPSQWLLLKEHARAREYQWYALLMPFEIEDAQKRMPGKWEKIGTIEQNSLWRIDTDF